MAKKRKLTGEEMHKLRLKYKKYLQDLLIDEISMTGDKSFDDLNQRLQEIKENYIESFGGVFILLIGDFFQLTLDVVDSFCYLGDTIGAGGGCDLSVITRIRTAWGKFRELLPILTSRALSYITRGQIYSTYIRTVLLYASECWAPNVNDLLKLQRNDRAMIRWTCNVRLKDHISSDSLLRKLGINNIQTLLRYN